MHQKLVLADDHLVFRAGTARILAAEHNFRIVAQSETFASLRHSVESFPHSIALFGASLLPTPNALDEVLRASNSRGVAIMENSESASKYRTQAVYGVVTRKVTGGELVACVRRVSQGELYFQPSSDNNPALIESQMLGERIRQLLTPKEFLVLSYVVRGYKNKQIAVELNTSDQVIKNHLTSIFDKTKTSDRLELALFTLHNKILADALAAALPR